MSLTTFSYNKVTANITSATSYARLEPDAVQGD